MKKMQKNTQIIAMLLSLFFIIESVAVPVLGAETGVIGDTSEISEAAGGDEVVEDGEYTLPGDDAEEDKAFEEESAVEDDLFIVDDKNESDDILVQDIESDYQEIDTITEEEYEDTHIDNTEVGTDIDMDQFFSENNEDEFVAADDQAIDDSAMMTEEVNNDDTSLNESEIDTAEDTTSDEVITEEPLSNSESSLTEPGIDIVEEIPPEEIESTDSGMAGAIIVASGLCGENVIWTLYSSGLLTISGDGDMTDYDLVDDVPWNNYKLKITSITISENVKHVGKNSFYSLRNLTNVTLPEGLESIGYDAFFCCYALTSINYNLPNQ